MREENGLDLQYEDAPAREEERLSKKGALARFDAPDRKRLTSGSFEALAAIHRALFAEVFAFAGEIRDVNLQKVGFRFASAAFLKATLDSIDRMPQTGFDEIVEKYVEMNVAHPFREGNGRAMRLWLDDMLDSVLTLNVDWTLIDKDAYLRAMARSPVDDSILKALLKAALLPANKNRTLFARRLDASWRFEGFSHYRADTIE